MLYSTSHALYGERFYIILIPYILITKSYAQITVWTALQASIWLINSQVTLLNYLSSNACPLTYPGSEGWNVETRDPLESNWGGEVDNWEFSEYFPRFFHSKIQFCTLPKTDTSAFFWGILNKLSCIYTSALPHFCILHLNSLPVLLSITLDVDAQIQRKSFKTTISVPDLVSSFLALYFSHTDLSFNPNQVYQEIIKYLMTSRLWRFSWSHLVFQALFS